MLLIPVAIYQYCVGAVARVLGLAGALWTLYVICWAILLALIWPLASRYERTNMWVIRVMVPPILAFLVCVGGFLIAYGIGGVFPPHRGNY